MTLELKFKLLATNSKSPRRATPGAACFDLYVSNAKPLGGDVIEYDCALAVEIPEGYVGLLFPRSSISERGQVFCNSVGVIDSDYRGSIKIRTYKTSDVYDYYKIGERCGQLMLMPTMNASLKQVDELSESKRGAGGFGSSGK